MGPRAIGVALTAATLFIAIAAAALGQPRLGQVQQAQSEPQPGPRPMMRASPMRPAVVAPTTPAPPAMGPLTLSNQPIVRISAGVRPAQILALRDDQMIETPSGRRMSVGGYRRIQAIFANARARTSHPRAAPFTLLPAPTVQGVLRRPGESEAQLLARPDSDVIRLKSGHSVSVAQLRIIATYLMQHGGLKLTATQVNRPYLGGPAVHIGTIDQLKTVPQNAPDSMVLESPKGTRITVGELRKALGAGTQRRMPMMRRGGAQ